MKLNITSDQLQEMLRRNPALQVKGHTSKSEKPAEQPKRAPSHTPGKMNKTEARFADILTVRKRAGEIADFGFEAYKLVLAYRTTYTPDFYVITNEGHLEFHEVKGGFIREDGWQKLKMAAEKFKQHTFIFDQWKDGQWITKTVRTLND